MAGNGEPRNLAEKIKWLLCLRVVTLTFFFCAAALLHFLRSDSEPLNLYALIAPLGVAYLISFGSGLVLNRFGNERWFAHTQIDFDVLLITGTIWITGDTVSPFSFLYNLAVMNGAILLFYRGAFQTAAFSSACYTALWLVVNGWGISGPAAFAWSLLAPLVWNIGSFFAIAALSGYLAQKLGEAEERLKDQRAEYQRVEALKNGLLQGVASGVAVTDVTGSIEYFNVHAQQLTALNEAVVKGKIFKEIFPDCSHRFDGANGKIYTDEFPFVCSSGESKQLRLTVAPLSDPNHQIVGYAAIFEDITKQRQLEENARVEEELRRAREFALAPQAAAPTEAEFRFEGVVGKSGGMENIYRLIQKVAAGATNVLITGESGTGKELVARAIHYNGARCEKPFVAVNCGAIPENLIESELFGHVRGAFTGAVTDHNGLFKQADQGTIFLDEVGELLLHLQVKLLRVLQEKTFTPVGGSKPIKVDVRVISATNRDLRKETEAGRFREDLFYRLNVVQMVMPPLRNRREDIPALAHYFLRKFATSHAKKVEEISKAALLRLMNHHYPGNVRELENIIEHAVAIANSNILGEEDLPANLRGNNVIAMDPDLLEKGVSGGADQFFGKGLSLDAELETHERLILVAALKRANGVQKRAAEILGINYRSLRHRLEKYDMSPSKQNGGEELASGQ
ncbi:MAG: PAS domain S-box protein [Deltaproteobacteria bacterium]|nr:PAS domain S-box protein [Deltaproteobacteria bacterium]